MNRKCIILVEDDEIVRQTVEQILIELGFNVCSFENSRSAVEFYREHHQGIAIALLDMVMPGLNGVETFMIMKQINPGAKVILYSGYCDASHIRMLLDNGANGFLQKPFRISELNEKLTLALAG